MFGINRFPQHGHIGLHPLRMHHQPVHQRGQPGQHKIEQRGRVRADHPLDRGVADIPLMPQGHVLQGRQRIAAQQAGQSAHIFQLPRVALMRHGRRALLAGGKRFLDLKNLGALQMAQLGRDPVERAADQRQGREKGGVPVTRDHLGGNGFRHQPQARTNSRFDRRIDIGIGANRPRDFADRNLAPGLLQAILVAFHLGEPVGDFKTKGNRLGMHAVAAADHDRVPMFPGAAPQHVEQGIQVGQQLVRCLAQLHGKAGINHIRRGQAEVQIASLFADALGHRGDKGNYIVLDLGLDFLHAADIKPGVLSQPRNNRRRDVAALGQGLARQQFDLQPGGKLVLLRPDLAQRRSGVTFDHEQSAIRTSAATKEGAVELCEYTVVSTRLSACWLWEKLIPRNPRSPAPCLSATGGQVVRASSPQAAKMAALPGRVGATHASPLHFASHIYCGEREMNQPISPDGDFFFISCAPGGARSLHPSSPRLALADQAADPVAVQPPASSRGPRQ